MTLLQAASMTEDEARTYLEEIRWPEGPICPHCNHNKAYALKGKAHRKGLYKCAKCRKQFTVTVGTVLHRSHISLKQWVLTFHLLCSSKKGMSALQLQRELGLGSYEAAWFLAHRIREAMQEEPMRRLLQGVVEVDETYVGGKPRKHTGAHKRGRGTKKSPVLGMVERQGEVVSQPVERVDGKTLKGAIQRTVSEDSVIMTDEWPSYRGLNKTHQAHQVINHGQGEYSVNGVNVNTIESFWSLLKRGIYGIFHHVSKKHLSRYCAEFSFRWNTRRLDDALRRDYAMFSCGGKRLTYRALVGRV